MNAFTLLAVSVALALDAFAVAIVTGLTLRVVSGRHLFRLGFHFGLFQAGMLATGWYVGAVIQRLIAASDHWIAFLLLLLVGGNIIRGALTGDPSVRPAADPTSGWQLVMLSFATSIDALAVGISLAMAGTTITVAALAVGLTAAVFTLAGMMLGRRIGVLWGRRVEVLGGVILILIGAQILWRHLSA